MSTARPAPRKDLKSQWKCEALVRESACAGCGREFEGLDQPDPGRPDELLARCGNQSCLEWAVLVRRDGRLVLVRRITLAERLDHEWKAARPSLSIAADRNPPA